MELGDNDDPPLYGLDNTMRYIFEVEVLAFFLIFPSVLKSCVKFYIRESVKFYIREFLSSLLRFLIVVWLCYWIIIVNFRQITCTKSLCKLRFQPANLGNIWSCQKHSPLVFQGLLRKSSLHLQNGSWIWGFIKGRIACKFLWTPSKYGLRKYILVILYWHQGTTWHLPCFMKSRTPPSHS